MIINCNCQEIVDLPSKPKKKSVKGIRKVLKKLKKNFVSVPCSVGHGVGGHGVLRRRHSSNTLRFHPTHGENIQILQEGRVARRAESFCKGIGFSNRPVRVGEYVYLKFVALSVNWSGAVRFGFTSVDPSSLDGASLPKYVCPDLTNKPGFWAKALPERLVDHNSVLFYYYTADGDVHFGINNQEMGVFFTGVDSREHLWAIVDVYGNTMAVELIDPNQSRPLNNARVSADLTTESSALNRRLSEVTTTTTTPSRTVGRPAAPSSLCRPQSQYHPHACFSPLPFHRVHGRNVRLSNDQLTAARDVGEFANGYVFTSRPLQCGERLVVQVQHNENSYVGALAFGLTSCDPNTLNVSELPGDSEQLLDRKEYWVVIKDIASSPRVGDELSFTVTHRGEVQFSCNGGAPSTVMYVDQTQQLWAFFDIYGNTQKLRSLGCMVDRVIPRQSELSASRVSPLRVSLPPSQSEMAMHGRLSSETSSLSSDAALDNATNECVVCCEKPVDSVLYTCGHMCMCYDCAKQLFERPGGQCPICRSSIRDVIRTYRS